MTSVQTAHDLHGFFDALNAVHQQAFEGGICLFGQIGFGHDGHGEAQLGGFLQSLLTARSAPRPVVKSD